MKVVQIVKADEACFASRRGATGCGLLIPLFLGAIFGTVGFCIVYFWGYPVLQKAKASTDWPTTKGIVASAEVIRTRDDDGVQYKPEVLFDYTVNKQQYQQSHIRYDGDWSTSSPTYANKMVQKYKAGTEVTVHYDPEDPFESVLEPGTSWASYFPIGFGAIFFLIGAGMFLGTGGYLLFGLLAISGASSGMMNRSGSSSKKNPYANPDQWDDDQNHFDDQDSYRDSSESSNDGFENL